MNIMLAPMEGVVDNYMRDTLTKLGGYDTCVTEFIRVTELVLPPKVFYRLCPELETGGHTASGTPVIVQLLGSNPDVMAENAKVAVELGAPGIDLNFGCPAKCVNKSKGGAVLLKEPYKLYDVIKSVRNTVAADVPVSAKIRLGYENTELALENALAVQEAGANFITVHARTKVDGYKAPARWEWLATINETLNIPMIANGDINSVEDYERCVEISACENIMIGRGAIARPDLARQISQHTNNKAVTSLNWSEVVAILVEYGIKMRTTVSDTKTVSRMKQWLGMLRRQFVEATPCFNESRKFKTYSEMHNYLQAFIE